MEHLKGASIGEALSSNGSLYIMRHSPYQNYTKSSSLPWFDLKVFYVQINNFHVDAKTPDSLLVTHIPLNPDTLLEFNGCRMKNSCNGVNSILRRDRVDKKSEEATFVSTDTIRLTGSVKFEVFNEEDLVLSGVLEMSNSNGFTTESKNSVKRWSMTCEQGSGSGLVFNKGDSPTIEVYVAGSFAGSPIILTKSLQICSRKKNNKVSLLCAIPENEATEGLKGEKHGFNLQGNDFYNNKTEHVEEEGYEEQMYWRRPEYLEGGEELDGELSWFNAGVRVGVGIGLGICVSVGVGVGLLVQSYQATTRNFRRRRLV